MTVSMTETEVLHLIGAAVGVGVVVVMLAIGWVIYLLVRPPRGDREAPPPEEVDHAGMLALIERMERRLEVLERAVGRNAEPEREIVEAGAGRPETRRIK